MSNLEAFTVDQLYSNEEIYRALGVGNAGGIRVKIRPDGATQRIVIMTSLPNAKLLSENPYHDRVEDDVLVYTGTGRLGDQDELGRNAKILQQRDNLFPIWGFQLQTSRRDRSSGPRRWKFLGLLQLLRNYVETQSDATGEMRNACVFEFFVHRKIADPVVSSDSETMATLIRESSEVGYDDDADREVELNESPLIASSSDATSLAIIRTRLLQQDPKHFEFTIGALLIKTGFQDVEVTRFSQDGGIDVNARPGQLMWPMQHLLLQVQAKRWVHTVGRREVAELRGSILPHSIGCIITTSHFTRAAITESSSAGKVPIALISGNELANLIKTYGVEV